LFSKQKVSNLLVVGPDGADSSACPIDDLIGAETLSHLEGVLILLLASSLSESSSTLVT
jgi:hypothetical protein